jgi:hypothetical protein
VIPQKPAQPEPRLIAGRSARKTQHYGTQRRLVSGGDRFRQFLPGHRLELRQVDGAPLGRQLQQHPPQFTLETGPFAPLVSAVEKEVSHLRILQPGADLARRLGVLARFELPPHDLKFPFQITVFRQHDIRGVRFDPFVARFRRRRRSEKIHPEAAELLRLQFCRGTGNPTQRQYGGNAHHERPAVHA